MQDNKFEYPLNETDILDIKISGLDECEIKGLYYLLGRANVEISLRKNAIIPEETKKLDKDFMHIYKDNVYLGVLNLNPSSKHHWKGDKAAIDAVSREREHCKLPDSFSGCNRFYDTMRYGGEMNGFYSSRHQIKV